MAATKKESGASGARQPEVVTGHGGRTESKQEHKAETKSESKIEPSSSSNSANAAANGGKTGLRVRMFRIGFGDFFLVSVPAKDGHRHILIDCGVHAKDLSTMRDAVQSMAQECGFHLALIIMTHRHADHISGFGTCSDIFKQITVDRVWMPWFENPENKTAKAFQASLTAMAGRLSLRLAARGDESSLLFKKIVDNITGGLNAVGVSSNQKALDVLHGGFKNKAEYSYFKAGDLAELPDDLVEAGLTAEILGPPVDSTLIAQMTRKSQQYLTDASGADSGDIRLFSKAFDCSDKVYEEQTSRMFDVSELKSVINGAQPSTLAAQAVAADNTLNNQSLVVLFGFSGKTLLFAGDAQWGNWENFLYGGAYGTPGHTEMTARAKSILNKIDFYKVGHHGSANATPKDAVAAMRLGCVGMCSTQIDAYNEVPREPLLDALRARMDGQLARSDQVAASKEVPANEDAGPLPSLFKQPTKTLFIDYEV
jgi:beta-lactamase superfamily II metal-dependent hydrolase